MTITTEFDGKPMFGKQCEPCGQFFTTLTAPVEDEYVVCDDCRRDMAQALREATVG